MGFGTILWSVTQALQLRAVARASRSFSPLRMETQGPSRAHISRSTSSRLGSTGCSRSGTSMTGNCPRPITCSLLSRTRAGIFWMHLSMNPSLHDGMKQESIGTFLLSATAARVLREKGTKNACKKEI